MLVEIDPRDYQIAVDKARAELADAEAARAGRAEQRADHVDDRREQRQRPRRAASSRREAASTAAEREHRGGAGAADRRPQARLREAEANATKAARDVERLRGLLAKDEVSQQQFDAAVAAADAQRAAVDSAQVAGRRGRSRHPRRRKPAACRRTAGEQQAQAALATRADGAAAGDGDAGARGRRPRRASQQAKAALAQAELNLQYTTVKAPARGHRQPEDASKPARSSSRASR